MASQLNQNDEEIISGINITPLVDIVLVLLIIFMVTASYIVQPSIKVKLPKAATGENQTNTNLTLVLTEEGKLYLNGLPINEAALRVYIKNLIGREGKKVTAIIGADRNVKHGRVVHIMDLVKRLGVIDFAINIDKESPSD